MATDSSVLAWRIPGTAEPGGLPSVVRLTRLSSGRNFLDMDAPLALGTLRPLSEKRGSPGPGKRLEDRAASCSLGGRPSTRAAQRSSELWPGALPKDPLLHWTSYPLSSEASSCHPHRAWRGPFRVSSGQTHTRRGPHPSGSAPSGPRHLVCKGEGSLIPGDLSLPAAL